MTVVSPFPVVSVPEGAAAGSPPERRLGARDGVRLMVGHRDSGRIEHHRFSALSRLLAPGDAVIINVSRTLPAALDATLDDGTRVRAHLSAPVAGSVWTVEPRIPAAVGSDPWPGFPGDAARLPEVATLRFLAADTRSPRLWLAEVGVDDVVGFLGRHGQPIRYRHTDRAWPLRDYQTVYATDPGSAEMPSAGRPFTPRLLTDLIARGVSVAPVVLHSGVASFESGEPPDAEHFRVPEATADVVNGVRRRGGRVIAVGTTTVRALESVTDATRTVHPGNGVTDLVVTPDRGVRAVDGIVTGWHEPGVSHLAMIEAIGGSDLIADCYREAVDTGYLWHEFGDSLVIL